MGTSELLQIVAMEKYKGTKDVIMVQRFHFMLLIMDANIVCLSQDSSVRMDNVIKHVEIMLFRRKRVVRIHESVFY